MRMLSGASNVDRVWADLQNGLRQIFIESKMMPKRYFELYTSVYDYWPGLKLYFMPSKWLLETSFTGVASKSGPSEPEGPLICDRF